MAEHSPPIPDDLATCQAQLRAALEQHAALLQRFRDLERQLDETCATTEGIRHTDPILKAMVRSPRTDPSVTRGPLHGETRWQAT